MPKVQMIIELDTDTGAIRVGHPENVALCDHMLAATRRILDRADAKRQEGTGGGGRIVVPQLQLNGR